MRPRCKFGVSAGEPRAPVVRVGMRLQQRLGLLAPFALVALFHHMRYATLQLGTTRSAFRPSAAVVDVQTPTLHEFASEAAATPAAATPAAATPAARPTRTRPSTLTSAHGGRAVEATSAAPEPAAVSATNHAASAASAANAASDPSRLDAAPLPAEPAAEADPSRSYPAPTLSQKRLLDGSQNWLPVPNAESDAPDDLAWRSEVVEGRPCPAGRRPYHTILTAQASLYQAWQTRIFYYHFKKAQRSNPCTEMVGFTRLLASANGQPDDMMDEMPTVCVPQLGFDKTRGFQVINRPWSVLQFLRMPEWKQRIVEDYVYIAETDHLLMRDIPNRATPAINVAFFFPYMSPVPHEQAAVIKRYFDGDHLSVQPVGPSPALMHVDNLKKLTPLWYELSVKLKHDGAADRTFGWVLEMWGYSLACARVGVKHFVWQQLQIEPSSTWHQNVSAEDPHIYHYTFGVEYSSDGIPTVGAVGDWSLDKRHYFGAAPPLNLDPPPKCALECAWVWWRLFNEATASLSA